MLIKLSIISIKNANYILQMDASATDPKFVLEFMTSKAILPVSLSPQIIVQHFLVHLSQTISLHVCLSQEAK